MSEYLNLKQLLHKSDVYPTPKLNVLKGIAYNFNLEIAYVKGKLWPKVIAFRPQDSTYAADLKEAGTDHFFIHPEIVLYIFQKMVA